MYRILYQEASPPSLNVNLTNGKYERGPDRVKQDTAKERSNVNTCFDVAVVCFAFFLFVLLMSK